ncbi:hypothetical protein Sxan_14970 [Streptomyces xanthophaeus]|uniref:Uncharacterized protein n=1 Tax=Streptomyces xanthophaeus TaxID=67385 RepID=A0A919GT42_9ACTN|nr:hypothetical protein Sxan_14970 [Streptomyces xanthophaeus]
MGRGTSPYRTGPQRRAAILARVAAHGDPEPTPQDPAPQEACPLRGGGLRGGQTRAFERLHPEPQKGTFWAGGVQWWRPVHAVVLLLPKAIGHKHNGRRVTVATRADVLVVDHTERDGWRLLRDVWISGQAVAEAAKVWGAAWVPVTFRRWGRGGWQAVRTPEAVPGWRILAAALGEDRTAARKQENQLLPQ